MYNSEVFLSSLEELQVVSQKEARAICELDALRVEAPNKKEAYVKANIEQTYVVSNVWIHLAGDLGNQEIQRLLRYQILKFGLIDAIKFCNRLSTCIIDGTDPGLAYAYWVRASVGICKSDLLQILRLAKRFTPHGGSLLTKKKLDSFLEVNRGTLERRFRYLRNGKQVFSTYATDALDTATGTPDAMPTLPPTQLHTHVVKSMRVVIAKMLRGYTSPKPVAKDHELTLGWRGGAYTNGASQNVCTCQFCKKLARDVMLGMHRDLPTISPYYHAVNRTPSQSWKMEYGKPDYPLDDRGNAFYAVKAITVPKDYKGPRIIAPEKFEVQYRMKAIAAELERCLEKNGYSKAVPLHDQSINQERARLGSIDGTYATLDLAHASDSVTKELVASVFPDFVAHEMLEVMPTHVWVDGGLYPLRMFGTMGSALTFIVESIIFYAVGRVATLYGAIYRHERMPAIATNTSYGDDMTLLTKDAETAIDILTMLGFEVNVDKSFFTPESRYRESCGKEWYEGCDISSIYWPRRDMSQDTTSWDGFDEVYESRDSAWLHFSNRLYAATNDLPNVCHSHSFMRAWLTRRFNVTFVPPQYAYPGMLIGDSLTVHVKDLLTRKRFETTWDEYDKHPEWRFKATTATKRTLVSAVPKFYCPCRFLRQGSPVGLISTWDSICYNEHLEFGPRYESRIDRVAHISSPRSSCTEALGTYKLSFRTSYTG